MSAGYCYASERGLSAEELRALIDRVVGGDGYAEVEEWTRATLSRLAPDMPLGLQGRAFSERGEVCWRHTATGDVAFSALALADGKLPLGGEWHVTEFDSAVDGRQVLWGEWRPERDGWAEARIPNVQEYPVAGSEARPLAALITRAYRQQGVGRITRFLRVEAISGKEGE